MNINIITLFPDFFDKFFTSSMIGRAATKKLINFQVVDLRKFGVGSYRTTDDRPFGGGPGMVMLVEPIDKALTALGVVAGRKNERIILTSAKGQVWTQARAVGFASISQLTIICGHYEGVDERVAEHLVDAEIRIGDYVLTGGEPAAMVITDSLVRLIPGVLGNPESNENESHAVPGKLAYPQFSRPSVYQGWPVPEVLLSGDHQQIKEWRQQH